MVKSDLVEVFKYTCKHHETHPTFIYKCKHVIFQYLIINSLKNTKIDALENNMSKTHVIMKMVYVRVWESEIWLKVK